MTARAGSQWYRTNSGARTEGEDRASCRAVKARRDIQGGERFLIEAPKRLIRAPPALFAAAAKSQRVEFNAWSVVIRPVQPALLRRRASLPTSSHLRILRRAHRPLRLVVANEVGNLLPHCVKVGACRTKQPLPQVLV